MKALEYYLKFCKLFHKYNLPKIRFNAFKEFTNTYKYLYKNIYGIDEDDINKATFVVFSISLFALVIFSFIFTNISVLYIIIYSFIISFAISYKINTFLYYKIKKDEKVLNALLYLIKIDFSLIKATLKDTSDLYIAFINLIIKYDLPISERFKKIFGRIHQGSDPKRELSNTMTSSEDFNRYLRKLLLSNFNVDYELNYDEGSAEKQIKVVIRSIESKLAVVFFVGLFLPIGLVFFVMLQDFNTVLMLIFIPVFLLLLNFLFKRFVRINVLLIGFLQDSEDLDRRKFNEFLLFLEGIAISLEHKVAPEIAIYNSYIQNKENMALLERPIGGQISHLLNLSYSLDDFFDFLRTELKSVRYYIILDTLERMFKESAYHSHKKIYDILGIVHKQQKLEEKLDLIIKSEKFKVLFFIFLLPVIIGLIGGILPLFKIVTVGLDSTKEITSSNYMELIDFVDLSIIFITLFLSNLIACYYFLKIIRVKKKAFVMILSSSFFVLSFVLAVVNLLTFFA